MAVETNQRGIMRRPAVAEGSPRAFEPDSRRNLASFRLCLLCAPVGAYWALGVTVALGLCSTEALLLAAPVVVALALCLNLLCGAGRRLEPSIEVEDAG